MNGTSLSPDALCVLHIVLSALKRTPESEVLADDNCLLNFRIPVSICKSQMQPFFTLVLYIHWTNTSQWIQTHYF